MLFIAAVEEARTHGNLRLHVLKGQPFAACVAEVEHSPTKDWEKAG